MGLVFYRHPPKNAKVSFTENDGRGCLKDLFQVPYEQLPRNDINVEDPSKQSLV